MLDIFRQSIFAIASFLQLTRQFVLATFHILAKNFENEGFFLAYTPMIKTFMGGNKIERTRKRLDRRQRAGVGPTN
jgi:hypothetical protein